MSTQDLALLGQVVLGYVVQWVRSFERVPNWVSWVVLTVASVGIYIWITPTVVQDWQASWRVAIAGCVSFILAARGAAAGAKEVRAAPKTNSL
mgnify:CR=1 FL=1